MVQKQYGLKTIINAIYVFIRINTCAYNDIDL